MLAGKKTYLLAALAIITAGIGYLTGDLSAHDALNQAWAGAIAATMRHGIG